MRDTTYAGLLDSMSDYVGDAAVHPHGLGDAATNLIAQSGGITTTALSLIPATAAIPGLGPAIALGAALVGLLGQVFSGCGQTCVLTSEAANKIETLLKQNIDSYFALSPRYRSVQAAALANFDNTWQQLVQYCGQAQFGAAGQNCIQDRQSGSCKWKASAGHFDQCTWTPAGAAGSGDTCWNWFAGYRDPIANDPCVQDDPPVTSTVANAASTAVDALSGITGMSSSVLLLGGLALLLVIASGGAK